MVPPFYDSMLAKIIAVGRTRESAILRMERALAETRIEGVKTTVDFCREIMRTNRSSARGGIGVGWLPRYSQPESRRPSSCMASSSRRHAREVALQALYGTEVGKRAPDEHAHRDARARRRRPKAARSCAISCSGTLENADESDALIGPLLEGWTLERLPTIDRIILRMSAFELNHRARDRSPPVVINEAVELAKKFSTEDSGRFVNGVLGRLAANAPMAQPRGAER